MKKRFKIAFLAVCSLLMIISAGCGSKTDNTQNQNNMQNTNHSSMPEMDHNKMQMDDHAKK